MFLDANVVGWFNEDTKNHKLKIIRNNPGLIISLFAYSPGTMFESFNVVITEGFLAIHGDGGSYMFSGKDVESLFMFNDQESISEIALRKITKSLVSVDKECGFFEFDLESFLSNVKDNIKYAVNNLDIKDREKKEIISEFESELSDVDDEYSAISYVQSFNDERIPDMFCDFEWNFKKYTSRYIWCCHAIAWALKQYALVNNMEEVKAA